MKSKKINLDLVVMYYVQINLFLLIRFSVIIADVDLMMEWGVQISMHVRLRF